MKSKKLISICLVSILHVQPTLALTLKFSCGPHGKSGADVDTIVIIGSEPKEKTDTLAVTATVKRIKIGTKIYKNLIFKGERSNSARGPYYELISEPKHKNINSIFISAHPSGDEVGHDEVITADGIAHKMSCSEQ